MTSQHPPSTLQTNINLPAAITKTTELPHSLIQVYTTENSPAHQAFLPYLTQRKPGLGLFSSGHRFGEFVHNLPTEQYNLVARDHSFAWLEKIHHTQPPALAAGMKSLLVSCALQGLNVPTQKVTTIFEDSQNENCYSVTECESPLHFGHFQYCHYEQQHRSLRELAETAIQQICPKLSDHPERYELFFAYVVQNAAHTVAQWQSHGFVHGLMDTNTAPISGATSCQSVSGFLETYTPGQIYHQQDHLGRYAFHMQPSIYYWNLQMFAKCFSTMVTLPKITHWLEQFDTLMKHAFSQTMSLKFGIDTQHEDFNIIMKQAFSLMESYDLDYTHFFYLLTNSQSAHGEEDFLSQSLRAEQASTQKKQLNDDALANIDTWYRAYHKIANSQFDKTKRWTAMELTNPIYTLRQSWLTRLQAANSEEQIDLLASMVNLLLQPYEPREGQEEFVY